MRPIDDMLVSAQGKTRFHMPGHKGRLESVPAGLDMTELASTDDLYAPQAGIAEAERLLARSAGAGASILVPGGSTAGILAMVLAYVRPGGRLLMRRDAHHAAQSACILADVEPVLLPPGADLCKAARDIPCDAIFAMHNDPGYPVGHLGFHPGPFMASADTVVIRVIGSGGHGAVPQRTVDPVVVCSAIVLALQSIVSRNVDPQDTAIVSVGAIHAGTVSNVIPASAEMILSVRALTAETRALLERRIGELARGQAASFGARAEVDYRHCHPVLVNHPGQTAFAREVARDWLGEECLIDGLRPFTASEDFAFILERCPGSYLVIGNGQGESGCQLHNPGYDFNDDCLAVGASYWVRLAERFLA